MRRAVAAAACVVLALALSGCGNRYDRDHDGGVWFMPWYHQPTVVNNYHNYRSTPAYRAPAFRPPAVRVPVRVGK